jgi:6-pyruvoyltetrahydropterin/6-carboxytetrahydropterin synthase
MLTVVKHYRFHAAHRNRELRNKCSNIHGHTYHITCTFKVEEPNPETGVTIEFAHLDSIANDVFNQYDHALLLHDQDPLLKHLRGFSEPLKIVTFPFPTSAENLAREIHIELLELGLPIHAIALYETPSSGVHYEPQKPTTTLSFADVEEDLPEMPHKSLEREYKRLEQEKLQTEPITPF